MLMRTDPFREWDRLNQQVFGNTRKIAITNTDCGQKQIHA